MAVRILFLLKKDVLISFHDKMLEKLLFSPCVLRAEAVTMGALSEK